LVVVRPDNTAPSFFNAVILSYRAGKRDKCGLLSPETWKAGRGTIKRQMWSSQTEDAERASKKKTNKQKAGAIVAASLKTERTVATASRH
jgi:hypothetical protein